MTKKFYKSKTFWANIIAAGAILLQSQFGFVVDIEAQSAIIIVGNLILRGITKDKVII